MNQLTIARCEVQEMHDHLDQARESLLDFVSSVHTLGPSDPQSFERFAQVAASLSKLGHGLKELLHSSVEAEADNTIANLEPITRGGGRVDA